MSVCLSVASQSQQISVSIRNSVSVCLLTDRSCGFVFNLVLTSAAVCPSSLSTNFGSAKFGDYGGLWLSTVQVRAFNSVYVTVRCPSVCLSRRQMTGGDVAWCEMCRNCKILVSLNKFRHQLSLCKTETMCLPVLTM